MKKYVNYELRLSFMDSSECINSYNEGFSFEELPDNLETMVVFYSVYARSTDGSINHIEDFYIYRDAVNYYNNCIKELENEKNS